MFAMALYTNPLQYVVQLVILIPWCISYWKCNVCSLYIHCMLFRNAGQKSVSHKKWLKEKIQCW